MRSGVPTNGVLSPKLKPCEKLMNSISARGAVRKLGKSGSIVIATSIAGTHTPAHGEVATGPFMNMEREVAQEMSGKKKVSTLTLRASIEEAAEAARKEGKEVDKGGRGE